jgi:hypothetical protein
MAASGAEGTLPVLWSASKWTGYGIVPKRSGAAVEANFRKAQPEKQHPMGKNHPASQKVATLSSYLPALSESTHTRHHLRQEPSAVNPLARIREGGSLQRLSLPRHYRGGATSPFPLESFLPLSRHEKRGSPASAVKLGTHHENSRRARNVIIKNS